MVKLKYIVTCDYCPKFFTNEFKVNLVDRIPHPDFPAFWTHFGNVVVCPWHKLKVVPCKSKQQKRLIKDFETIYKSYHRRRHR